ncbi:MAG: glycosyltransferase family 87 protein [Janthinobacterium lividum]
MVLPIDVLRSANWLTTERARAWCRILAAISLAVTIAWVGLSRDGVDRMGKPLGTDFVSFWTAGRLVRAGDITAPYRPATHAASEQTAFPTAPVGYYAFFYPPVALLLFLPLAALPYLVALMVWLASTGLAALACLRCLLPQRWALLPMLAFPAVLVNAGHGQNGFLSTACFGGGMLLRRRPMLAGMCLGALVFKPQLGLLVPIGLLAARRWRMLAGASISAIGLCALSWLLLGDAAWRGFLDVAPLARRTLEAGLVDPAKMVSTFAGMRVLHSSLGLAYAVQAVVTAGTGILLALTLARRPGGHAEGAMLAAAAMLATPFLLDYDLMILALPLAWVMAEAQRTGWRPWEKLTLLAAYVLPMVARPIAMNVGIPLAPSVLAVLLVVIIRRADGRPA